MSRFKKRHFEALKDPQVAYLSPLAVVAHIDLDAFYVSVVV